MTAHSGGRTKADIVTEFREAEIIDAARRVIVREGPHNASMEKIAEEANISKGTLYLYFDSKEALFREATERGHAEMAAIVHRVCSEAPGPVESIGAYLRATLEFCEDNEILFRAMYSHPEVGGDKAARAVDQNISDHIDILEGFIVRGIEDGILRAVHPRRFARLIVEGARGAVIERLRDQGKTMSVKDEADMLLGILLDGARARA